MVEGDQDHRAKISRRKEEDKQSTWHLWPDTSRIEMEQSMPLMAGTANQTRNEKYV